MREQQPEIREKLGFAVRASRMVRQWAKHELIKHLLFAFLPGLVMAFLGPLGSYDAPLSQRLSFWVPTMAIGAFSGSIAGYALSRSAYLNARPWLKIAIIISIVILVMTAVVFVVGQLVFGPYGPRLDLSLMMYVSLIAVVMIAVAATIEQRHQRVLAASPRTPDNQAIAPAIVARLSQKLKSENILALEAEDHYVRVHTAIGSELILIRLSDAAKEMGTVQGARAHRSWWVARTAVQDVNRTAGRITLVLSNGTQVPVSRGYASELREAGWFAD